MTNLSISYSIFDGALPNPLEFKLFEAQLPPFSKDKLNKYLIGKFYIISEQKEINSKLKYRAILDNNIIYLFSKEDNFLQKCLFQLDIEFSSLHINVYDDINQQNSLHSFTLKRKDKSI